MKKGLVLVCVLLAALMALPALAQSTGVDVDGKTYVITGGDGTYELNGMIFIIGENTVIVKREGQEDLRLTLEAAEDEDVVASGTASGGVTVYSVSDQSASTVTSTFFYTFEEEANMAQVDVTVEGIAEISEAVTIICTDDGGEAGVAEYSDYAQYGLSYDEGKDRLYYMGRRVRAFEDVWSVDGASTAACMFLDDEGEVDVRALRDAQGVLTGLEALREEEFAAHDLSAWKKTYVTRTEMTATDGDELTSEELEAFFAPYAAFGLRYDAQRDLLFYNGRQVRKLVDYRRTNGADPGSGDFSGELTQLIYDDGEVDVTTIRDYAHPDAGGDGKLIGLHVEDVK